VVTFAVLVVTIAAAVLWWGDGSVLGWVAFAAALVNLVAYAGLSAFARRLATGYARVGDWWLGKASVVAFWASGLVGAVLLVWAIVA
jgi:hypothetical protein